MKIGICGTHSVGKTTLLNALSTEKYFQDNQYYFDVNVTRWVKALGFNINKRAENNGQEINLNRRICNLNSFDNYIGDRTIIDVLAYSKIGSVGIESFNYQYNCVSKNIKKYDYIFRLNILDNIEDDGIRDVDKQYQKDIDATIEELLNKFKVQYISLTGSTRERVETLMRTIGAI